ncbi:FxsA family protein [Acuticoccus sp. I52.16.1]|nr:FxsA family protein [Acuticoccus sp. I52.16.1]UOM36460.1 FxsA family protein [Acuticoccus sp. I52.16.1]
MLVIRSILFAFLLIIPIAEIVVFLTVGSVIGVLPTIAIIILTAVLGAILLKRQGLSAFARLQADASAGRVPAAAIGQAITVAIAGILLLTPGFITDTVGFLLFIPAVRSWLWKQIAGSVRIHGAGTGGPGADAGGPAGHPYRPGKPQVIDLEATEVKPDPSTPWRNDA